jgi:hypothetical protein
VPKAKNNEYITVERWRVEHLLDDFDELSRYIFQGLPEPWRSRLCEMSIDLELHDDVNRRIRDLEDEVLEYAQQHATPTILGQERAYCPLCGDGRQDGQGFALPLGLERHLRNSDGRCDILRFWRNFAHMQVNRERGRLLGPFTD